LFLKVGVFEDVLLETVFILRRFSKNLATVAVANPVTYALTQFVHIAADKRSLKLQHTFILDFVGYK
jgi:hypothetical protein